MSNVPRVSRVLYKLLLLLLGLLVLAPLSFAKAPAAAEIAPAAVEDHPRISLAATAAAEFIAAPNLANATAQYETWLAGQSYASVIQAYKLFDRISLREPELADCAREKEAITTEITANPFALAPAVLALKCAEFAGDSKLAAQLEVRIQVRLSMLLADGRGQLQLTPAKLLSWWDIPAFADISGLQWRSTIYSSALSVGALTAYTSFESEASSTLQSKSVKPTQSNYFFEFFDEKFRAGLSAREYETPWQKFSAIQDFMKSLAKADDLDAKIYLHEYAIATEDGLPEALMALREMLKQPESALLAAIALVQVAAWNKNIKLVESDLDPLFDAAEARDFQAIIALVLERTFGLVDAPNLKEAETLLTTAQKSGSVSNTIAQIILLDAQRNAMPPAFALRALQIEVEHKQPAAIVTAYFAGKAYKEPLDGGAWLTSFTGDKARFDSLKDATGAAVFITLAALDPKAPYAQEMACKAADFGLARAKAYCLSYLEPSDQRLRYLMESASEDDVREQGVNRIAAVSQQLAEHFEYSAETPDLNRAAQWALSGIAFGNLASYDSLAHLALRGAKLSDFDWNLARRLFAQQTGVERSAQTALELEFGGSDTRPKLFAELMEKCREGNAPACEVWAIASDLNAPDSQSLGSLVAALQLCVRAKDHQKSTLCEQNLGIRYIYGDGLKKDVARGLAYLEQLEEPTIRAINEIAWIRCAAPASPLYAPAKTTKYWPKLIAAKVPAFQDTLAACYAASSMFELASGMLEKMLADLPDDNSGKNQAADANDSSAFRQILMQHLTAFRARKRWVQLDLN